MPMINARMEAHAAHNARQQAQNQPASTGQQPAPQPQSGQVPPAATATPTPQQGPGLPPTGLQAQLQSLNSYYEQVSGAQTQTGQGARGVGFDVNEQQFGAQSGQLAGPQQAQGSTSLNNLARSLAQSYGLPIGRGNIVDENGNFLVTPQQLADASGGQTTMGEAAAMMNQIGQAMSRQQNEQQQKLGIGAIQAGIGQIQSRGRGSLAALQSGMYQDMADLYSNQEYEAADFSFWIQKEQRDIETELQRRAEKKQKKAARIGAVTGVIMVGAGLATGNVGLVGAGAGQVSGNAAGTGWF